jgi:hypothetical protein
MNAKNTTSAATLAAVNAGPRNSVTSMAGGTLNPNTQRQPGARVSSSLVRDPSEVQDMI